MSYEKPGKYQGPSFAWGMIPSPCRIGTGSFFPGVSQRQKITDHTIDVPGKK